MNDTIIEITGNGVDIHIPLEKKNSNSTRKYGNQCWLLSLA